MGLRDRFKERDENEGFIPLELNEMNVDSLFNKCLATSDSKKIRESILFCTEYGYSQDVEGVKFDSAQIIKNVQLIDFLYGQIECVHPENGYISPIDLQTKYDGTDWTDNHAKMMELLYLGRASGTISPLIAKGNFAMINQIPQTLSPKDSHFSIWYKEYEKIFKPLYEERMAFDKAGEKTPKGWLGTFAKASFTLQHLKDDMLSK